ncbi:MAG: lysophospholipid acyltransferase family protein [Candidatus Woesearchaeota archaeon]
MSNTNNNNNDSLEKRAIATHVTRTRRNPFLFNAAKMFAWSVVKAGSYKHYDIPQETQELMIRQKKHRDVSIYYVSPHKGMWETVGTLYTISWHDGDVPFVMMGSNLLKKETGIIEAMLKYVGNRSGLISVEREINPKTAAPIIISDISNILSAHRNVLIYPEGTRSRTGIVQDFKPAGFQGLVQAVSNGVEAYIVPVNVDYSKLIEIEVFAAQNGLYKLKPLMLSKEFADMTKSQKLESMREIYYNTHMIKDKEFQTEKIENKYNELEELVRQDKDFKSELEHLGDKYTFRFKDIKNMWKTFIGDTDISFGKPWYIERNDSRGYRGELAKKSRELCLDLVKIHKINVLSEAIVRMNLGFGAPINNDKLYRSIISVMKDLSPYEDRFRHFSMTTRPEEIVKTSHTDIASEKLEEYKIYANQIHHYLPNKQ